MNKLKPTGFVAICQCGEFVGAMDYKNTPRKEAGKMLGEWLHNGCTVQPRFECDWSVHITSCKCKDGEL